MSVIDAHAHVIESESTWDCMVESEWQYRPRMVAAADSDPAVNYWHIDGPIDAAQQRREKSSRRRPHGPDMSDLSIRLKHMNELGIDMQVIYPMIFIFPRRTAPRSKGIGV
jgi:hypothetical protein